jgi:flagellar hook assembly protein FlgD
VRTVLAALVTALLVSLGAFPFAAPAAARASTDVKVAIIVGATHGVTPSYRADANEIYAEAVKYTSNVVKVYSPNATAAKVKAAVKGASIVVYLGHGNGWPSPYTFDPNYTTKNGFGLNADLNNDGKTTDYENKYYGEPWIRDLDFAPNAVVLLFHLCYASGNSEPGNAEPSLSTAKKRVDNYAAAFLKAGAKAVIASGHSHDPYYISGLFTTRQTIEEYWRNSPDANGNFASYPSDRNPGKTFQMDPDRPGQYYRSIAGTMSLKTQDVTGATFADTSADPPTMVVPGNASPGWDGAGIYDSIGGAQGGWGSSPFDTLTTGERVRVVAREWASAYGDGSPIYRVEVGDAEGWMRGSSLIPRDSAAPELWEVDDEGGTFSPNGDDSQEQLTVTLGMSEAVDWTVRITTEGGTVLTTASGEGETASLTWSPAAGSVDDGRYLWTLEAVDGWGNGPLEEQGSIKVDTTAPTATVEGSTDDVTQFSPNGDGSGDSVRFHVDADEPGTATATVRNAADEVVARVSADLGSNGANVAWDGTDDDGATLPDGDYTLTIAAKDRSGNRSETGVRHVVAYAALGSTAASAPVFFPQDGDTLGNRVTFSFDLASPATVDWTVETEDGAVVRTIRAGEALAAGPYAFAWDGRDDLGALVPRGTYRTVVTATDGEHRATQRASVVADAFRITVSDDSPGRGQKVTITALSAEVLDGNPRVKVFQPGKAAWSEAMKRTASRTYKVTITLKSSATGTLRLRIGADDDRGGSQSTNVYLPLH